MTSDPDEWGARAALPLLEIADDLPRQVRAALLRAVHCPRRMIIGPCVNTIDRFNGMLTPHWQGLCDPDIRELAIMPEIDGEEEDELEVGGEDQGEDGAPP